MNDQKMVELVNQKILPAFSPEAKQLGILVILEIIASLITIIQNCPNMLERLQEDSPKVLRTINHPNIFNKLRLYLTVRRQCKKAHTEEELHTIVNAILKAGQTATKEDILTICDAVKLASAKS
jgi:hypothetical protein